MRRRIVLLLGVLSVPILLALGAQALSATVDPPQLPSDEVVVDLEPQPSEQGTDTASPSADGSSGGAGDAGQDQGNGQQGSGQQEEAASQGAEPAAPKDTVVPVPRVPGGAVHQVPPDSALDGDDDGADDADDVDQEAPEGEDD